MKYQRKKLENYPLYEVDTDGNVYSLKFNKERLMKQCYNMFGYKHVSIVDKNGKRKTIHVHRLIAQAFIPNLLNKREVNHINGNKDDNSVKNLQWSTRLENMRHAHNNNLINIKGENHPTSKLTKNNVIEIYKLREAGMSNVAISKIFGVSNGLISVIVNGKVWKEVYNEYHKNK